MLPTPEARGTRADLFILESTRFRTRYRSRETCTCPALVPGRTESPQLNAHAVVLVTGEHGHHEIEGHGGLPISHDF